MSIQADDPLYKIFEKHLHSGVYDNQTQDRFIRDVVEFYFVELNRTGHVPHRMHDLMRGDLAHDVQAMLKAKIYGHYGIGDYNRKRMNKSNPDR